MKILFTGGGSGGHFYPIIAIAEALYDRAKEKKVINPTLYFMAPSKYNPRALFDNDIEFISVPCGKWRRYFSILNFIDLFKTTYGIIVAIIQMYRIYPDVVFGKGGHGSFPALVAAKLLKIPVVIHESDTSPGIVNKWAAKFARKIAVSYPEAIEFFPTEKVALTGLPIRNEVRDIMTNGAREFLNLEENIPTILILGGSQGSEKINDAVISSLPDLVERYQIIHQTGRNNFESVKQTVSVVLQNNTRINRYHPFDYLNDLSMRMSAGVSNVIVSRAGSTIFEIASWGKPSIIIPLPKEISHDQTDNAFSYARSGACTVIEEYNLSSHILVSEIDRIINNHHISERMSISAKQFSHSDASTKIADVLLEISLEHA